MYRKGVGEMNVLCQFFYGNWNVKMHAKSEINTSKAKKNLFLTEKVRSLKTICF